MVTAKPWAIYIRVSTDEQAAHGVSLDMQRASCEAYLTANRLSVARVYEDAGHSAKNLKRPAMQDLLAQIEAGAIGGVVAWKLDRLSRSVRDLWDLIERAEAAHVGVACVQEKIDTSGPYGRFIVTVLGAIAQLEREQIAERVTGAIRHIQAKGGFHGGNVPCGFYPEGARGDRKLVLDPTVGTRLAPLWSMLAEGASLRDLCAYLNQEVKTRRGKPWAVNTIAHLLRNERYVGQVVTRKDFTRALTVLDTRWSPRKAAAGEKSGSLAGGRNATRLYVLAGVAQCARCGAALTGAYGTGRNGRAYYYRCSSSNRRGKAGCTARMLPATAWEQAVFTAIDVALTDRPTIARKWKAIADAHQERVGPLAEEQKRLTMDRDREQQQIDRLVDALATGGATARAVQAQIEKRQPQLESILIRLASIDARLAAAEVAQGNADAAVELMRQEVASLPSSSPEDQQRAIRSLVRSVKIAAGTPTIELELIVDVGSTGRSHWRATSDAARTDAIAVSIGVKQPPRGRRSYPAPIVGSVVA
jgi:site-specific DNA recombinase